MTFIAVFGFLVVNVAVVVAGPHCDLSSLVTYNVTFVGLWSRESFPKQYPLFRPHAQWTKVIGRTHSLNYQIFGVGEKATEALQDFTERGRSHMYDRETQGQGNILDIFTCPALDSSGVGYTSSLAVLDGRHSLISLTTKIVPSPDWFVGVDSLDLCPDYDWLDELVVDLQPMDAGTDQGFTFTAPNWPDKPHKLITTITSKFPDHPANSFFYPDLETLPPIARLIFEKVAEYNQTFSIVSEWESEEINDVIETTDTSVDDNNKEFDEATTSVNNIEKLNDEPKTPPLQRPGKRQRPNRARRPKGMKRRRQRRPRIRPTGDPPINCEVSGWSAWAACSKTCGFGTTLRTRSVIRQPENYGRPCPELEEDNYCGSMRTCNWDHFGGFRFGESAQPEERRSIFGNQN